jgi:hypothetical protein
MFDLFGIARLNSKTSIRRSSLILTLVLGLSTLGLANAQVYRYEQGGQVFYSDSVPANGGGSGHTVLNNRGVVLEQVKSREERRVDQRKEKEAKALQLRDKTLLRTFTAEEDLIRTRDERLGLIDGNITRLDDRVRIVKESLGNIIQRIEAAESSKGAGNAPAELYAEHDNAKKKITNTWALIDTKSAERKELATNFEADLARYRWLKSGAGSKY